MTLVFERRCVSATPPSATTAPGGDRKEVKMSDNFTLESFSQNPFYQEVNRRLVALARLRPGQRGGGPPGGPGDALFFGNAIHLVKEKAAVVQQVYVGLREGGTFSFNTSFFQGAEPPESLQFYRRWMMKALRFLREQYGLSPDREQR